MVFGAHRKVIFPRGGVADRDAAHTIAATVANAPGILPAQRIDAESFDRLLQC
jgi:hypothetical protein